ncbi:Ig-like domain-containing protein [Kluyvera intermedia]|uniref:Ig-like domain-containing protein n=1 Tax=Kluyvera intermedia TaxID=61648 RepID=UPI0035251CAC
MLTENNPDAIISVVFATSNNIPADGTSTASVTAQVTDSAGAGLSGQSVVFTATAGALIGSPVITDTSGLATTTLTSTTAGVSSVTASINDSHQNINIYFTDGGNDPDAIINFIGILQDNAVADGIASNEVIASVTDKQNNPLAGQYVTFSTDNNATITLPQVSSDSSGYVKCTLTSTTVGICSVKASINDNYKSIDVIFTSQGLQ